MGESTIFQYSDIFLAYLQNDDSICSYKNSHHCLKYVYSGEIVLEDGIRTVTVHSGEAVFICKDHNVRITKQPYKGKQFKGITMVFNREFLRNLYQEERKNSPRFPIVKESFAYSMIKLPNLQEQSTLMALKTIFGYLFVAAILIAILSSFTSFHKINGNILPSFILHVALSKS